MGEAERGRGGNSDVTRAYTGNRVWVTWTAMRETRLEGGVVGDRGVTVRA